MLSDNDDSLTIGVPDDLSLFSTGSSRGLPGFSTPTNNPFGPLTVFHLGDTMLPAPLHTNIHSRKFSVSRVEAYRSSGENLNGLADAFTEEQLCHACLLKVEDTFHGFGPSISSAMMNAHNAYHQCHTLYIKSRADCFVCQLETSGHIQFTKSDDRDSEIQLLTFNLFEHITNERKG